VSILSAHLRTHLKMICTKPFHRQDSIVDLFWAELAELRTSLIYLPNRSEEGSQGRSELLFKLAEFIAAQRRPLTASAATDVIAANPSGWKRRRDDAGAQPRGGKSRLAGRTITFIMCRRGRRDIALQMA
jgi:hypothetical protein